VFVVSNPVDILTQLAFKLGLPWQQVYGLGTMLDTSRFSSFIANELQLASSQVKAISWESMGFDGAIWSSATVNGLPLTGRHNALRPSKMQSSSAPRKRRRIIKKKGGGAGGWHRHPRCHSCRVLNARSLVASFLLVQAHMIFATLSQRAVVVGRKGVERHEEIKLGQKSRWRCSNRPWLKETGEGQNLETTSSFVICD